MKFKKIWILWICYYSVAIIGTVLAAVLLRDRWNFNAWSAFPIAYIVILAFLVWYFPSDICYERSNNYNIQLNHWYISHYDEDFHRQPKVQLYLKNASRPWFLYWSKVALFCIPIYPYFIFFFSNTTKGCSFLFFLGICVIALALWMLVFGSEKKEIKAERAKEAEELKKQREREELGRWK